MPFLTRCSLKQLGEFPFPAKHLVNKTWRGILLTLTKWNLKFQLSNSKFEQCNDCCTWNRIRWLILARIYSIAGQIESGVGWALHCGERRSLTLIIVVHLCPTNLLNFTILRYDLISCEIDITTVCWLLLRANDIICNEWFLKHWNMLQNQEIHPLQERYTS